MSKSESRIDISRVIALAHFADRLAATTKDLAYQILPGGDEEALALVAEFEEFRGFDGDESRASEAPTVSEMQTAELILVDSVALSDDTTVD
jgi:hypothetical protein